MTVMIMSRCVITGNKIIGDKHNVWPVSEGDCCEEANMQVVVPYRLFLGNDKKDKAMLLKTDNTIELIRPKDKHFTLEELQELVGGGLIEYYPHRINGNIVIVNEEGLLKQMPYNRLAKIILKVDLVGPVIVIPKNLVD